MNVVNKMNVIFKKAILIFVVLSFLQPNVFALEAAKVANSPSSVVDDLRVDFTKQAVLSLDDFAVIPLRSELRIQGKAIVIGNAPLSEEETKRSGQWGSHAVSAAYHEKRVLDVLNVNDADLVLDVAAAQKAEAEKKPDAISKFVDRVWAPARADRELEVVLKEETDGAKKDLRLALGLIRKAIQAIPDEAVRKRLSEKTRFGLIFETALLNQEETDFVKQVMGFPPMVHHNYGLAPPALFESGNVRDESYHAALAIAGTFPYEVSGKAVEEPRSVYFAVGRLKHYALLGEQAGSETAGDIVQLLADYLKFLDSALTPAAEMPSRPAKIAEIEQKIQTLWLSEVKARKQSWKKVDERRVTETFVAVDLSKVLGEFSEIPEEAVKKAESFLEDAKRKGFLKDYIVLRIGEKLLFDVTHQRGARSPEVHSIIQNAAVEAVRKGAEKMGRSLPADVVNWKTLLNWHDADWRYTERSSQPTLRQVIVGGSPKATDGIHYDIYASPAVTTQQAIEGTHGTFWVVQNTKETEKGLGFVLPGGRTNKGLFDLLAVAKTSNHAIRAIFAGKGSRFPLQEPLAASFSLGDLQIAVFNSQAGAEAIGGILGPATNPRIVEGYGRRLSLKPVTHEEAVQLTKAKLQGELAGYAPTIIWGSQMFENGEFDELTDLIKAVEFSATNQLAQIRAGFAKILLGQGESQPFLNTEEANSRASAAFKKFTDRSNRSPKELEEGTLTTGVFKADIGSRLGHTAPLAVFMAVARAVLEQAKREGLIKDYLVKRVRRQPANVEEITEFRVGDDIELHVVHDRPIGDKEIHQLAWRAFWAAGWVVADVLKRKPYGLMQDLPNAKDLDAFLEASLNPETFELILGNLKELSTRDSRAIDANEIEKVRTAFEAEHAAQQAGTRQKKVSADQAKFQFTGNVKGSGIGSAEGYITPGRWSILAFDKASPGAFSVPFINGARRALAAGAYPNLYFEIERVRPEYDEQGKEIPTPPVILDYANLEDRALIEAMLGAVNEFQVKAIRTRGADGKLRLVAVNSTDRLYQVTAGIYAGKDDPVSALDAKFASFVFQWMKEELFITEGDERGSHWAFVLPVPMDKSSPGTHSIPIAVGLNFTITDKGEVVGVQDVFDSPDYNPIRDKAADYNHYLIRAVGNLPPRGDADSVEYTYPLWQKIRFITSPNSPYALPLPVSQRAELRDINSDPEPSSPSVRIAINGAGRIGVNFIRAWLQRNDHGVQIVAINDLAFNLEKNGVKALDVFARSLQREFETSPRSSVGDLNVSFTTGKDDTGYWISIGFRRGNNYEIPFSDNKIYVFSQRDPAQLPWRSLNVDQVIESTGVFTDKEKAAVHLKAGAKKVLISAPAKGELITVVPGINSDIVTKENDICSGASCTTGAISPVLEVLKQWFGGDIEFAMDTTHAFTSDQSTLDSLRVDNPARGLSASQNIVVTTTGAAQAIGSVIPELAGKGHGIATRVPVPNGSKVFIPFHLVRGATTSRGGVNNILREASTGSLKGILAFEKDRIDSSKDILGRQESSIVSGEDTWVAPSGQFGYVVAWYDNEFGYANRLLDLIGVVADKSRAELRGLPALDVLAQRITPVQGAQTGQVSLAKAIEAGATGVIAGHSETRLVGHSKTRFGDLPRSINDTLGWVRVQLASAVADKRVRTIVLAIGELQKDIGVNRATALTKQLKNALTDRSRSELYDRLIIAYEPKWAITGSGTGEPATPKYAQSAHRHIRRALEKMYGKDFANTTRIIYGGSVNEKNARDFLTQPDIDGLLVGSASATPAKFLPILKVAGELAQQKASETGRVLYIGGNHKTYPGDGTSVSEFAKTVSDVLKPLPTGGNNIQIGIAPELTDITLWRQAVDPEFQRAELRQADLLEPVEIAPLPVEKRLALSQEILNQRSKAQPYFLDLTADEVKLLLNNYATEGTEPFQFLESLASLARNGLVVKLGVSDRSQKETLQLVVDGFFAKAFQGSARSKSWRKNIDAVKVNAKSAHQTISRFEADVVTNREKAQQLASQLKQTGRLIAADVVRRGNEFIQKSAVPLKDKIQIVLEAALTRNEQGAFFQQGSIYIPYEAIFAKYDDLIAAMIAETRHIAASA